MPPLTLPFQCLLVYLYHFLNDSLSGDSYSFLISRTGGITLPYPSVQCLQLHTRRTRPAPYHFLNELLSGDSYREILSGQDQTTPLLLCSITPHISPRVHPIQRLILVIQFTEHCHESVSWVPLVFLYRPETS